MAELQRGVVKWFNDAKGFGFIEHTSGRDVFVHYSVIEWDGFKTLKDGEEVHYELSEGDKGLHAAKVVRVADAKEEGSEEQSASSESMEASSSDAEGTMPELEIENTPTASESEDATINSGMDSAMDSPSTESIDK